MNPDFRFPDRVRGLRELMAREQKTTVKNAEDGTETETVSPPVDAVIVSYLENVRYLTGFTGSNGLALVTPHEAVFITDGRYTIQASREVGGWERVILPQGSSLSEAAGERLKAMGVAGPGHRIGYEQAHLTVSAFDALKKALPEEARLEGKSDLVESLRQIKDADEVAAIRRAIAIADACFDRIREVARVGKTEKQVAWEIEMFMRGEKGAARLSFESIVAAGPHSALPHARPSDRKLGESGGPEFVIFDYGCEVDGYCSDITRTLVVGGAPTERHKEIYGAVLTAQQAALDAIKPGVIGRDVDKVARDSFAEAGLADYFTHGLGHALGRVVHDGLGFSQKSELTLRPGMVLTVEPGVYIEAFGGVRIEDDILVTETGCEILTKSTKELIAAG